VTATLTATSNVQVNEQGSHQPHGRFVAVHGYCLRVSALGSDHQETMP
jgi:hypothetical protein